MNGDPVPTAGPSALVAAATEVDGRVVDTAALMSRFVVTVGPECALADLEMLLLETGFATVPVVDDGHRLVGLVRPDDLPSAAGALPRPRHAAGTAADVMRRSVSTANPSTTLGDLVRLLWRTGLSSVPVLDGDELVGIAARRDVASALADLPLDARRAELATPPRPMPEAVWSPRPIPRAMLLPAP